MSTITKEQAQSVSDLKAGYTLGHADVAILNELARIALASLEANGTLTNEGPIPAGTPCKDAPEHIWLQTAGVWPENGEFSELTWCSDNQHPDDTLYVRADVVTGNSPVIPDGWMMVPIEPTKEMINSAMRDNETGEVAEIYELMLAAAPQQEVK
ncbi:hypothetical protein [Enterobacter kobei]|uniref:hypothetical protein n=1 Tax=Enterobacter kobei TaxID=208224 RepID=UPI002A814F06|nr:hypothetical protein [Enterobacter kobei]